MAITISDWVKNGKDPRHFYELLARPLLDPDLDGLSKAVLDANLVLLQYQSNDEHAARAQFLMERLGDVQALLDDPARLTSHNLNLAYQLHQESEVSDPKAFRTWLRDRHGADDAACDRVEKLLATSYPRPLRVFRSDASEAVTVAPSAAKPRSSPELGAVPTITVAAPVIAKQPLFADSLRIAQRLADSDPGNAEWQRDLSISLIKNGDLMVAQGNLLEAQRLFTDSLRILQRLADSDPGNAGWQRDLSVSLNKLGDLAVAQRNLPEAQRLFADALRIRQRLADSDPGNAGWQRDLSVSLNKLGDLSVAQRKLPEAQRLFADSLRIRQRLADSNPGNAEWQRDLWVSHWRVAYSLEKQWDSRAAEHWRQAHEILAGMIDEGLHVSAADRGFLAQLKAKLGE